MFYVSSFWTVGGEGEEAPVVTDNIWWDRARRRKLREIAYYNLKMRNTKHKFLICIIPYWWMYLVLQICWETLGQFQVMG